MEEKARKEERMETDENREKGYGFKREQTKKVRKEQGAKREERARREIEE